MHVFSDRTRGIYMLDIAHGVSIGTTIFGEFLDYQSHCLLLVEKLTVA
jgi:hypothetical protein